MRFKRSTIDLFISESFERKQQYGLTLLVSTDDKVKKFLESVTGQMQASETKLLTSQFYFYDAFFSYIQSWLESRQVKRLVVVLSSVDTQETLERWEFNVEYSNEESGAAGAAGAANTSSKDLKKIQGEIRDVIRQITASVTFLPLLDCLCSFDILIYTNKFVLAIFVILMP